MPRANHIMFFLFLALFAAQGCATMQSVSSTSAPQRTAADVYHAAQDLLIEVISEVDPERAPFTAARDWNERRLLWIKEVSRRFNERAHDLQLLPNNDERFGARTTRVRCRCVWWLLDSAEGWSWDVAVSAAIWRIPLEPSFYPRPKREYDPLWDL